MLESTKSPFLKGKIIAYLPKCRSTNSELVQLCHKDTFAEDILALYTDEQTHGRGQRNNTWSMCPGKQLAISVLLRFDKEKEAALFWLPIYVALHLKRYVLNLCANARVCIKWPNDVYVNDKKIGGILTETVKPATGKLYAVVGIGLNLFQTEDLRLVNGISLEAIGVLCNKADVRNAVILAADQAATDFCAHYTSKCYIQQINESLRFINDVVVCFDSVKNSIEGKFLGLDIQGRFCIKTQNGTVRLPHHLWSSPKPMPEYLREEV